MFSTREHTSAPAPYKNDTGNERMSIDIPLPSGVIIAETTRKKMIANRAFVRQNEAGTAPSIVSTTINTGIVNAKPVVNKSAVVIPINSETPSMGVTPMGPVIV